MYVTRKRNFKKIQKISERINENHRFSIIIVFNPMQLYATLRRRRHIRVRIYLFYSLILNLISFSFCSLYNINCDNLYLKINVREI